MQYGFDTLTILCLKKTFCEVFVENILCTLTKTLLLNNISFVEEDILRKGTFVNGHIPLKENILSKNLLFKSQPSIQGKTFLRLVLYRSRCGKNPIIFGR